MKQFQNDLYKLLAFVSWCAGKRRKPNGCSDASECGDLCCYVLHHKLVHNVKKGWLQVGNLGRKRISYTTFCFCDSSCSGEDFFGEGSSSVLSTAPQGIGTLDV